MKISDLTRKRHDTIISLRLLKVNAIIYSCTYRLSPSSSRVFFFLPDYVSRTVVHIVYSVSVCKCVHYFPPGRSNGGIGELSPGRRSEAKSKASWQIGDFEDFCFSSLLSALVHLLVKLG